jgi:transcriptional regulator with XRE-family HTH domain
VESDREPTMRAAWLGQELRALREGKKITAREVAGYLGKAPSTLSRLESGLYPPRETEVTGYLELCGVNDPHKRTDLLTMCHDVGQRGWWNGYEGDVASSLMDRMWIEAKTLEILACDLSYFPGLLQTPEYAEALFRTGSPHASNQEITRWSEFRMTRQHVVNGLRPLKLACLIDEYLLHRMTGSAEVMKAQLDHLLVAQKKDNVDIRVLPAGMCNGVTGSFEVLTLDAPYPRVGYVATSVGDICVEGESVEALSQTYDRLLNIALTPAASRKLITAERNKL